MSYGITYMENCHTCMTICWLEKVIKSLTGVGKALISGTMPYSILFYWC